MKNIIIILLLLLNLSLLNSQTPVYYPGFPKIIDSIGRPSFSSEIPLITDLDKDGQKEIIFVTLRSSGNFLYVIKSDGNSLTGFPKMFNNLINSVSSGDVDGNGWLDIAIRTSTQVTVIDRFGNNLPGFPVAYNDGILGFLDKYLSLYDLDNNGKLEIIVNKFREVCVFNFDGTIRTGWPKSVVGTSISHPAIGDIDNDGSPEIIVATYKQLSQGGADSSALRIFRSDGSNFSSNWPVYYDSNYYSWYASPTIYLNKNNVNSNIIAITQGSERINYYVKSRNVKYNIYGNIINRSYSFSRNDMGSLVIGDINMDGTLEFSNGESGNHYESLFYAYTYNLQILNNWPRQGGGASKSTPIIGKFTFGGNLNILANTWSATAPPDSGGFIYGYNYDGSQLPWSPLRPTGLVYAISTTDLNNDGSVELIAISSYTGDETYLHIWTFPGIAYSNENFPWPQYGHDRYRTNQYGFIPPDDPIGIQPINSNVPVRFNLYQNYPNPFNPSTKIRFDISGTSVAQTFLSVYDVLGREVTTLVNEDLKAGEYRVSWDASMYSSGIYFYRLIADNYIMTMKMIILK